jgi:hypothetical protein
MTYNFMRLVFVLMAFTICMSAFSDAIAAVREGKATWKIVLNISSFISFVVIGILGYRQKTPPA